MAKPHRHNTRQTKLNRPRTRPYAPSGLGSGSLSRFLPGRSGPTDADAGQTDVSINPARRNDRTPRGRSFRRRRQRPRRRSTTLRLALQPLHRRQRRHDFIAGRRSQFLFVPWTDRQSLTTLQPLLRRQTTPLQADGPGSGSSRGPIGTHSCCCLRRRPRRQPTYPGSRSCPASRRSTLRSPGNSTLEPQFLADSGGSTHDVKLHFASHSLTDSALSIPAHTVES